MRKYFFKSIFSSTKKGTFNKGFDDPILPRIFKKLKVVVVITGDIFKNQQKMIKQLIGNIPVHSFVYASTEGLYGVSKDR